MSPDLALEFHYCNWRFRLWHRNYGTYQQIDDDFESGKLAEEFRKYLDSVRSGVEYDFSEEAR